MLIQSYRQTDRRSTGKVIPFSAPPIPMMLFPNNALEQFYLPCAYPIAHRPNKRDNNIKLLSTTPVYDPKQVAFDKAFGHANTQPITRRSTSAVAAVSRTVPVGGAVAAAAAVADTVPLVSRRNRFAPAGRTVRADQQSLLGSKAIAWRWSCYYWMDWSQ